MLLSDGFAQEPETYISSHSLDALPLPILRSTISFAQHLNSTRPGVSVTITPDLFHRLKDTGGSLTKQAGSTFDRAA
jgi:hypothetical protein